MALKDFVSKYRKVTVEVGGSTYPFVVPEVAEARAMLTAIGNSR